ncbi:MAG: ribosome silencing factor [Phycisphaerae bacterium]|jgi:ribosome-associated protein|nr:ribosome silencing factor [Phycisphaerae bacterium]MDP7637025.1 ribosome silencing factor [Phycisphaerae bacterium]
MARRASRDDAARKLAIDAARLAHDSRGEDIIVLNLRGMSPVTDYFVVVTGTSDRQMRSVADDIKKHGREIGQPVWHVAGRDSARWILLDFVDVVVHIFGAEYRGYYDLELIWGGAPRVRWRRRRKPQTRSDS